jgi:hypothetical protein
MKKLFVLLLVISVSISCKKSDVPPKLEEVLDPIEGVKVIVPGDLQDPVAPQGDPKYNVIGYGYDVTGKFNDASAIREKVIDIPAYVAGEKPSNLEPWTSTAFGHDSYDGENAEVLAKKLSDQSEETKNRTFYGGTISESFPGTTAFSEKYVYGYYTQYLQYKMFKFLVDDRVVAKFRNYLSPSFKSDVQNLSPEMIVKKYGTHILANILIGAKLDIIYQAETNSDDRSSAQKNGYDAAIKTTFGFWTSRFEPIDSARLRTIKSPTLSFRVAGGDPSKIKTFDSPKGPKVDFSEWVKSAEKQNHVFIKANSTIPLFSLIADETKRTEVQSYIATYLENNEVKLSK